MKNIEQHIHLSRWLLACVMAFILLGCGSSGGGTDTTSLNNGAGSPAAPPSGGVPPGTVPVVPPGGTVNAAAPTILSSDPSDGTLNLPVSTVSATNMPANPKTISATFSQPMNPADLVTPASTFTVWEGGSSVGGSVSLNASGNVATFSPTNGLKYNTKYTVSVTKNVRDRANVNLVNNYQWVFTTGTFGDTSQLPINLGSAAPFLVLGTSSIDNTSDADNPTHVNGQLGILNNPLSVSGFTNSDTVGTGIIQTDGVQQVPSVGLDFDNALNVGANRSAGQNSVDISALDLSEITVNGGSPGVFPPGLYSSNSSTRFVLLNSGNMVLDATGNPDAVWVFKVRSSLEVGNNRKMVLINGAKANNIYWIVGTSASLGNGVDFKGNILARSSITLGTAANGPLIEGRVMSKANISMHFTTLNMPAP